MAACTLGFAPGMVQEPGSAFRMIQLAQETARLTVPATLTAPSSSSLAFPIGVPSPHDLPPNSFVRIRGLPAAVSLTEGFAISAGTWAVPLAALSKLRLIIPVGVSGDSEVTVSLVAVDGAPLAEAKLHMTVTDQAAAPPQNPVPGPAPTAQPNAPTPPAPPILTEEARDRAERLVQRGEKDLTEGNVSQARSFFLRAAEAGFARGALMLATTYDPVQLSRLRVQGVQPNPAEARKWYERARELGAPEATERLSALSRN